MNKFLFPISVFFWVCLSWNKCHPVDILKPQDRRPSSMDYEQWEFLEPQIVTTIRFSNLNNDSSFEEELGSIQPTKASSDRACAVAGDPNTSFQGDEKEKTRLKRHKAKGKPNSIDLTFHLLREYLQMAKEEKMAQKAFNNKKLMQAIGK